MTCRPSVRIALVIALAVGPLAACGGSGTPIDRAEASSTVSGGSGPTSPATPSPDAATEGASPDGAQPAQTTTGEPPATGPAPAPPAQQPDPGPVHRSSSSPGTVPPAPPLPAPPPPGPSSKPPPAPEPPPAPGAPYDINAFDEIQAETIDALDFEVKARCGSPEGGPTCLVPVEKPRKVPEALRSECRIRTLTYEPGVKDVEMPDGELARMLARGTRTIITANCVAPFDALVGKTLADYHAAFDEQCFGCQMTTEELPAPVTDQALWSSCTVTGISYDPVPIVAGWDHPVLADDTKVTVTTSCPAPPS